MNLTDVPENLPEPMDDGATAHLAGTRLPAIDLQSTSGRQVDFASRKDRCVVYIYPMTGRPDVDLPEDWDMIPGARGCTPQTCAFRDHHQEIRELGAEIFGLSTQNTDYQREMVARLQVPFEVLSDCDFAFTDAVRLPTFEADGMRLLKRLTLMVKDGVVEHVFYPVFPSHRNAGDVCEWLAANG